MKTALLTLGLGVLILLSLFWPPLRRKMEAIFAE